MTRTKWVQNRTKQIAQEVYNYKLSDLGPYHPITLLHESRGGLYATAQYQLA